jgi:hypothetical protein
MPGDDAYGPLVTRYMRDRPIGPFNFQAIERRARSRKTGRQPLSKRTTFALGALAIAVPTMALGLTNRTALEAQITAQLSSWDKRAVRTTFLSAQRTVTLATAKQSADFHFRLPIDLPDNAYLERIEEIDRSSYIVTYRRSDADALYFSILKRKSGTYFGTTTAVFVTRGGKIEHSYRLPTYVWNVGDETVILTARGLRAKDVDGMVRAMGGTKPAPLPKDAIVR